MSEQVHRHKHERIADALAREIKNGRLQHGVQLPGEYALANRFDVSRNTVRQALTELGKQGLISTQSGRGSFVTFDGRTLDDRLGWTKALSEHGVQTRTEVLRIAVVTDLELAERCAVPSAEFVAVDRLRLIVDGPPISVERSRIPPIGHLRDLPETGLHESLYAVLQSVGLVPAQGDERAGLVRLTAEEAEQLGRAEGDCWLRSRRNSRDSTGQFVEYVESLLDPDHFELHIAFGGDL